MVRSDPRVAIGRRDLSSLTREKTIVLAVLIQLFVAAFSSFLVVGLTSLYDPGAGAAGDVDIGISGDAAARLEATAAEIESVDPERYETNATAMAAFENGGVDAVLLANRASDGRISVRAIAPEGSLSTTLVVVQLRDVLERFERTERFSRLQYLRSAPVPMPDEVPASPYFGFTYTILIPLLMFLPPFISGSIAVDAITEEIERGTLELLRVAPVSLVDIVDGKAIAMALLAPLQALLWIVLLGGNGIAVANAGALLVTVAAMATVVVGIGIALGLALGERKSAQLVYSIGVLGLFGSAIMLPEHPATTVAKLAIDSPTTTTYALVGVYVALAIAVFAAVRAYVSRMNPETL